MIENSVYELRLFNCNGEYLFNFDAFESIDFGRQKNDIGICELIVPNLYELDFFDKDCILEIWRHNKSKGIVQLISKTCWFLRRIELYVENQLEEKLKLTFFDTVSLLKRRNVAWFEVKRGIGVDEFTGDYPSGLITYPDVVVDRIFYHNFIDAGLNDSITPPVTGGPPFTSENLHQMLGVNRTGFPIAFSNPAFVTRDTAISSTDTFTFAQQNCLEAMRSVVDTFEALYNREMWFDIEYTPSSIPNVIGTFEFKVSYDYPGVDNSWPNGVNKLIFGPEFKNVANPNLTLDFEDEATEVIAVNGSVDNTVVGATSLLDGVTIPQSIAYAARVIGDRCLFYPIEAIVTGNTEEENENFEDTAPQNKNGSILTKANAELNKRRPKHTFTGDLISYDGCWFFIDFQYGDLITVNWKGLTFNASIKTFSVTYDQNGETITIPFESSVTTNFKV